MQLSQRRTEGNFGLGLSKHKQTSRSQSKKSKISAGPNSSSHVVLVASGLKAQFVKTQSSGFQGMTLGSSLGSGNGVGMAGGTFSGAMAL
jgi:hypothetical protein